MEQTGDTEEKVTRKHPRHGRDIQNTVGFILYTTWNP